MKNTSFKLLCFLMFSIISIDAYSQGKLKAPPRDSDDGQGKCWQVGENMIICEEYLFPFETLTFDYLNADENGCAPVTNLGCDLHIGFTFGTYSNYDQITSCTIDQMIESINSYDPETGKQYVSYPKICLSIPTLTACTENESFTLDLYCKGPDGTYTSISELSENDPYTSWASEFPSGDGGNKTTVKPETWTGVGCCDLSGIEPLDPELNDGQPLIGQDDQGTAIFIKNINKVGENNLILVDANYQKVNIKGNFIDNREDGYKIDISHLRQGVYYIRITSKKGIYSKTIIKM